MVESKLTTAIRRARNADMAWHTQLKVCGIDRYSPDAIGKPGTALRDFYEMKVLADRVMAETFAS